MFPVVSLHVYLLHVSIVIHTTSHKIRVFQNCNFAKRSKRGLNTYARRCAFNQEEKISFYCMVYIAYIYKYIHMSNKIHIIKKKMNK